MSMNMLTIQYLNFFLIDCVESPEGRTFNRLNAKRKIFFLGSCPGLGAAPWFLFLSQNQLCCVE